MPLAPEPSPANEIVLVDEQDRPLGTCAKMAAHVNGGRLHRAFSVFLFDAQGRMLLQQRAMTKYHFSGLWTNACCSHPRPGEAVIVAARRRVREELGVDVELKVVLSFVYRAEDPRSGLTEHEYDHVLVGRLDGNVVADSAEVAGGGWVGGTVARGRGGGGGGGVGGGGGPAGGGGGASEKIHAVVKDRAGAGAAPLLGPGGRGGGGGSPRAGEGEITRPRPSCRFD